MSEFPAAVETPAIYGNFLGTAQRYLLSAICRDCGHWSQELLGDKPPQPWGKSLLDLFARLVKLAVRNDDLDELVAKVRQVDGPLTVDGVRAIKKWHSFKRALGRETRRSASVTGMFITWFNLP